MFTYLEKDISTMSSGNSPKISDLLRVYTQQLEARQSWGSMGGWRYSNFKQLSEAIKDKTGTPISHTTLSRIFQKEEFKRTPQQATLNALAQFLDYANWEQFCVNAELKIPVSTSSSPPKSISSDLNTQTVRSDTSFLLSVRNAVIVLTACLLLLLLGLVFLPPSPVTQQVSLSCLNSEGIYPHNFAFSYRVPSKGYLLHLTNQSFDYGAGSVDSKRVIELSHEDTLINYGKGMYPDYYWARILKNGKVHQQIPVSILTHGWLAVVNQTSRQAIRGATTHHPRLDPLSLNLNESAEGLLKLPSEIERKLRDRFLDVTYETSFFNVQGFGIDANELTFETRMRINSALHLQDFHFIRVTLLTSKGMIEIPLISEGCQHLGKVWFSDYHQSWEDTHMDHFQKPQLGWERLKITTRGMQGKVFLNGVQLETIAYTEPLGELTGIRFKFSGTGEVDFVHVLDGKGRPIMQQDFSKSHQPSLSSVK